MFFVSYFTLKYIFFIPNHSKELWRYNFLWRASSILPTMPGKSFLIFFPLHCCLMKFSLRLSKVWHAHLEGRLVLFFDFWMGCGRDRGRGQLRLSVRPHFAAPSPGHSSPLLTTNQKQRGSQPAPRFCQEQTKRQFVCIGFGPTADESQIAEKVHSMQTQTMRHRILYSYSIYRRLCAAIAIADRAVHTRRAGSLGEVHNLNGHHASSWS